MGKSEPTSSPLPAVSDVLPHPAREATTRRLCGLTVGVLIFHVLTSALQEHIFHLPGFSNVLLLSFGETLCTTVLVALQLLWTWYTAHRKHAHLKTQADNSTTQPISPRLRVNSLGVSSRLQQFQATLQGIFHPSTVELHWYVRIALLMSCSLYLTNRTSFLLSYPLQVIFKSSKLLCMVLVRRWWMAAGAETERESASEAAEDEEERQKRRYEGEGTSSRAAVKLSRCRHGEGNASAADVPPSQASTTLAMPHAAAAGIAGGYTSSSASHHSTSRSVLPPAGTPTSSSASSPAQRFPPRSSSASRFALHGSPAAGRHHRLLHDDEASVTQRENDGVVHVGAPTHNEQELRSAARDGSAATAAATHDSNRERRDAGEMGEMVYAHLRRCRWPSLCCCRCGGSGRFAHATAKFLQNVCSTLRLPTRWVNARAEKGAWDAARCRSPRGRIGRSCALSCSRHGVVSALRACIRRTRALLQDGELLACTVIVLGLIFFTYASQLEAQTLTDITSVTNFTTTIRTGAPSPSPPSQQQQQHVIDAIVSVTRVQAAEETVPTDLLPQQRQQQQQQQGAELQGIRMQEQLSTATVAAHRSSGWFSTLARLYALWVVTLVGVAGVLLSNLIDAVIYVLEEVYCFMTAAPAGGSTSHTSTQCTTVADAGGAAERNSAAKKGGEKIHAALLSTQQDDGTASAQKEHTAKSTRSAAHAACFLGNAGSPSAVTTPTVNPVVVHGGSNAMVPVADTQRACGDDDGSEAHIKVLVGAAARQPGEGEGRSATPSATLLSSFPSRTQNEDVVPSAPPPHEPPHSETAQVPVPASSPEVLFMLNGIATLLYGGSLLAPCLTTFSLPFLSTAAAAETTSTSAAPTENGPPSATFSILHFTVLVLLASVTSLIGTLCLLSIVAEYTGVMAVVVTSMRKTMTILLSFVLYGRRFTVAHGLGLAGVMGGVVWNELLRRRRQHS